MVGDYISVSPSWTGTPVPVFTVASEGKCKLGNISSCNVWEATATIPLPLGT